MRQALISAPNPSSLAALPTSHDLLHGRLTASPASHDLLQLADILWFMNFIRRHKYRLILGIVIASALGALYFLKSPHLYESTSQLLVIKKNPLIVQGMPSAVPGGADVMSTHIALITSPWLAGRVLSDDRLSNLETFTGKKNPIASLLGSLEVVHQENDVSYSASNVLEFSFRSLYPYECQDVLHGVIDAYCQYLNESSQLTHRDASALITQKADQVRQRLENQERDYKAFRMAASKRLISNQDSFFTKQRIVDIDSSLVAQEIRRAETASRLSALRKAVQSDGNSVAARAMLPEDLNFKENQQLTAKLLSLLDEEQEARMVARLGAGHPKVKAIREQIELTRQLFSESIPERWGTLPAESPVSAENPVGGSQGFNPVAEYTLKLEQELELIVASQQSLNQELEQEQEALKRGLERERDEATQRTEFDLESEQFTLAIARDQRLHDALMSQLQRVELDIVSGSYRTTLITPPNEARLVSPRLLLVSSLSIFLGIVAGFGYAISAEISSRLSCSTQEVARSLNVPVLGQIPPVVSNGAPLPHKVARLTWGPALCTHRSPDSSVAEAYRCLRTALYFHAERRPLKIVVMTSPNMGDGTSTLTANLAVSIAQSGKQVLLIDANLHSPRVHEVFGVSNDQGLATVLAGKCTLNDAITESGVAGLFVLPCGPRSSPSRPADLFSAPYLKEVFNTLREEFDYILVDTPGMLAVSDAQILAAISDGVLLTVRCDQKGGPAVARAGEMLEQSGAHVLGVVLNGAGSRDQVVLGDNTYLKNGKAGSRLTRTLEAAGSAASTSAL